MTVSQIILQLRQLVLEHPHAAHVEFVVSPLGEGHRQPVTALHFNTHETKIVLESGKGDGK